MITTTHQTLDKTATKLTQLAKKLMSTAFLVKKIVYRNTPARRAETCRPCRAVISVFTIFSSPIFIELNCFWNKFLCDPLEKVLIYILVKTRKKLGSFFKNTIGSNNQMIKKSTKNFQKIWSSIGHSFFHD